MVSYKYDSETSSSTDVIWRSKKKQNSKDFDEGLCQQARPWVLQRKVAGHPAAGGDRVEEHTSCGGSISQPASFSQTNSSILHTQPYTPLNSPSPTGLSNQKGKKNQSRN